MNGECRMKNGQFSTLNSPLCITIFPGMEGMPLQRAPDEAG